MSSTLKITDVPEETLRILTERASANGVSLNRYLCEIIAREVERPTRVEVLERAAARPEKLKGSFLDAVQDAREEAADIAAFDAAMAEEGPNISWAQVKADLGLR